jgi:hypothetical protein
VIDSSSLSTTSDISNDFISLESCLLTTENRFHAQHLLPRAVDKITNDYVASIYEAYQADIDLSLEDSRRCMSIKTINKDQYALYINNAVHSYK